MKKLFALLICLAALNAGAQLLPSKPVSGLTKATSAAGSDEVIINTNATGTASTRTITLSNLLNVLSGLPSWPLPITVPFATNATWAASATNLLGNISGDQVTTGTVAEARIHADVARDTELNSASNALAAAAIAKTNGIGYDTTLAGLPTGDSAGLYGARKTAWSRASTLLSSWDVHSCILSNTVSEPLLYEASAINLPKNIMVLYGVWTNGLSSPNRGYIAGAVGPRLDSLTRIGPLIQPAPATFYSGYVAPGRPYQEGGTNYFTFFGGTGTSFEQMPSSAGIAWSTNGTNWTVSATPLITPGTLGEWDDGTIFVSSVTKSRGQYFLFYNAYNVATTVEFIGLAVSSNLFGPYTKVGSVLTNSEFNGFAADPQVLPLNEGGWGMLFRGINDSTRSRPAAAFSWNLTNWFGPASLALRSFRDDVDASASGTSLYGGGAFEDHGAAMFADSLTKIYLLRPSRSATDWTELQNVPAGFADGVDDAGAGGASPAEVLAIVGTNNLAHTGSNYFTALTTPLLTGAPVADAGEMYGARKTAWSRAATLLSGWDVHSGILTNTATEPVIYEASAINLPKNILVLYGVWTNGFSSPNRGYIAGAVGPRLDSLTRIGALIEPAPATFYSGYISPGRPYQEGGTNYLTVFGGAGTGGFEVMPSSAGIAWSTNGTNWTVSPTATIAPGAPGQWDDGTIFVSSVTKSRGQYFLFYNAYNNATTVEFIGLAVSSNLFGPYTKVGSVLTNSEFNGFAADPQVLPLNEGGWGMLFRGLNNTPKSRPMSAFSWNLTNWFGSGSMTLRSYRSDVDASASGTHLYGGGAFEDHGAAMFADTLTTIYLLRPSRSATDWTELQNVPAGFSDGVDDGASTAAVVAIVGTNNITHTGSNYFSSLNGPGSALTSLTAANIAAGTAGINISGNAATATAATTATTATTATDSTKWNSVQITNTASSNKWIRLTSATTAEYTTAPAGGDVSQASQNNFTGSNSLSGATLFNGHPYLADGAILKASNGQNVLDPQNRTAYGSNGVLSVDFERRELLDYTGNPALSWSNGTVSMPNFNATTMNFTNTFFRSNQPPATGTANSLLLWNSNNTAPYYVLFNNAGSPVSTNAFGSAGGVTLAELQSATNAATITPSVNATNAGNLAFKPANNAFSGSNNFSGNSTFALPILADGSAVTNLAGNSVRQGTNTIGGATVDFSRGHLVITNMAGDWTITGLANMVSADDNWQVIKLNANGSTRVLTVPADWYVSGFTNNTVVAVTNGTWAELCVSALNGIVTNAAYVPYY